MDYQVLLDDLHRSVQGSQGVLLLDAAGEVVLEAGSRDERVRLIGAYQGIVLAGARKTTERYAAGEIDCLLWRYEDGSVVLRALKDGYYLVMSLARDANPARAVFRSALTQAAMNAEL